MKNAFFCKKIKAKINLYLLNSRKNRDSLLYRIISIFSNIEKTRFTRIFDKIHLIDKRSTKSRVQRGDIAKIEISKIESDEIRQVFKNKFS